MSSSIHRFPFMPARLIAATALVVTMSVAPGVVMAAVKDAQQDRVELRISDMHNKLKITQAQEEQWGKVAEVMREDAKTMDALVQTRRDHAKDATAIDDLTSYSNITAAHADGIKSLIPVFTVLYSGMSDPQKQAADSMFRHGGHESMDQKHGNEHSHKASAAN